MFRECGELYGRRFPLKLKAAVYKSYVRPDILHRNKAWCLKQNKMGIFMKDRDTKNEDFSEQKYFARSMPLFNPNRSFRTSASPKVFTPTTIFSKCCRKTRQ